MVDAFEALHRGDFSFRLSARDSTSRELVDAFNALAERLDRSAAELARVTRAVRRDGESSARLRRRGGWETIGESVHTLVCDLVRPSTEVARVLTAVAEGDLSQKMALEIDRRPVRGEFFRIGTTVNRMVDQLRAFTSEVTRVAREVGTEGVLGGQAVVPGAAGTWKDLTDGVNGMASNVTTQVRGIAKVVTAVAKGDLSKRLVVEAKGELAELADTINDMTQTLGIFADQVTTVAREVGTEGRLGGQARVPGAAGTWRDLVDNVNQLADSLTNQIRTMAEVATAVTQGDLTRSITVEARGEVLELKERVNEMIVNLRETTQKNREQDWLKTNLAAFGGMMQGHESLESVGRMIMSELTPRVQASHGAFFVMTDDGRSNALELLSTYAYKERRHVASRFRIGEGLVGQAALEKKSILVTRVPPDYIQVISGLGQAAPLSVLVLPVLFEGEVRAVIELASFEVFSATHRTFLEQVCESIGVVLNVICANRRTEELLAQSQTLAEGLREQSRELQRQQEYLKQSNQELEAQARTLRASEEMLREQQEELQQVNAELEEKASLLVDQNNAVEQKNREVEAARLAVEDKAAQLALSSKYKSEFMANMSHELRTPLNSLLILARMLGDNEEQNLTDKQVEYARTIHAAGAELLELINEVLDLSKVEAGKMEIEMGDVVIRDVLAAVESVFRPVAQPRGLAFDVEVGGVPATLRTDGQRLVQILRNLVGNAFKFTETGGVRVRVGPPPPSTRLRAASLTEAREVIAFQVVDTGIGIAPDKQELIFEAFQQADGTTSRRYGGTGLGLSISRELARLLGGELHVESMPGEGSTFTLYLPSEHALAPAPAERAATAHEGLVAEAALLLDRADARLGARLRPRARDHRAPEVSLAGKRVLVVDDDVRNLYALAAVLEEAGMSVAFADNGREGIGLLEQTPEIDLVLMDVMMPELDGYETMRRIRSSPGLRHLPVLALTAKAMKGDREKCLAAGASDYVTKPVEPERLLSLMGVWLCASTVA